MTSSLGRSAAIVLLVFFYLLAARVPELRSQVRLNIHGHVLGALGHGENIEVVLYDDSDVAVSRVYTNSEGDYEFKNIAVGRYFIVAKIEGFKKVRERIDLTDRSGYPTVNLPLEPEQPDGTDFQELERTEILTRYPQKVLDDYDKAMVNFRGGMDDKAIEELFALTRQAPDFYSAHVTLATIYQKHDHFGEAEREFDIARQLNPASVHPLLGLAGNYMQAADVFAKTQPAALGPIVASAREVLAEAIKLDPGSADAYLMLGIVGYRSNVLDDAERNLKKALEINDRMGQAHLMLANVYSRGQRYPDALEHLDTYLEQNPRSQDREQVQKTRTQVVNQLKGTPTPAVK